MKKIIKYVSIFVIFMVVLIYLTYGHILGQNIKTIMISAFESYHIVKDNPYNNIISDEYYNRMVKNQWFDFSSGATSHYQLSNPFVIYWFDGAYVYIKYSYEYYQNNVRKSASWNIPVKFTLTRQGSQWKVINMYEPP